MMRRKGGVMRKPCRDAYQDIRMMHNEGALAPPSYRMMQIPWAEAQSSSPDPREERADCTNVAEPAVKSSGSPDNTSG